LGRIQGGANWVKLSDLNSDNSSPLVLKAKEFAVTHEFKIVDETYADWQILI